MTERGWSALLLDTDRHPRFHIGESLLPLSLPMFDKMGGGDAIEELGLRRQPGVPWRVISLVASVQR